MKWFLVATLLGIASAQNLFFKPYHKRGDMKAKENFGSQKTGYFYTSRKTALELAQKDEGGVVVCPDRKSACPVGNTCCILATGAYGCCPLPNAVCCPDKRHCCPFRTTCEATKGQCLHGRIAISWLEKTSAIQLTDEEIGTLDTQGYELREDNTEKLEAKGYEPTENDKLGAVICPDGLHECQDGYTCCKSESGYACCPYDNAVCCSDQIHCCPENTKCDLSSSKCVSRENDVRELAVKETAVIKQKPVSFGRELAVVVCPDHKSECQDGQTCCLLNSGEYGCCPLPDADCCDDRIHCCPHGATCDTSKGQCQRGEFYMDWFEKTPAAQNVVCPGGKVSCPSGNTCCRLSSGEYGCCPMPNAVCCSDHVHCCPHGTTCDVSQGTCIRGDIQTDWSLKTLAEPLNNIVCPDGQTECPDGNTCCKLASGQYGCCPMPNAVCCSDHVHCCPHGTTCDVSQGTCIRGDIQTDWSLKTLAEPLNSIVCPDGQTECPDGNTCCKLASGQYGCCPMPNAVCCSDHVHCCPHGTTCDVSQGTCIRGDIQTDWSLKTLAEPLNSIVCPDGQTECPDGNTCCKLASGQYGCCPMPNAVCCSDHVHCCPHGTTCDVSQGTCIRGDIQTDWSLKTLAEPLNSIVCPDGQTECPDGNTCCKLASGQYGCCPMPNAVCCSDHVHCCPHGTTCDVSQGTCIRGDIQTDWSLKTLAEPLNNIVCPDGQSECPDGNTCCKLASGQYGCCPMPNAVCCSDGVHCCPHGYTCDVSHGKCEQGDRQIDWLLKTPAKHLESVRCPDGKSECPDGNTCCKLPSGDYGCCPLPNAVCCSDGEHCCPHGYTCDVSHGKCEQGDLQIDWLLKTAAKQLESVRCPDGKSECPDGNTCCKLPSGDYGCCPLPNAVCCSDGEHCCPHGYTCDVSHGKCEQGDLQIDWLLKTAAKQLESVRCPDGKSECPDGNTCCKLPSGDYGCCPLPNAVCCSDGEHCCPHGYTCDVSHGKCEQGDLQIDWLLKTAAKQLESVRCPDGKSECPDGNTCCKLPSGDYGCCPLPNAVCCSDGEHCCPHGYTCDVSHGKCEQGDLQIDWLLKTAAKQLESVRCPDGKSECPDGNTCCKLPSGDYGCCPLPNAVCCSDGEHCCPHGYTCDVSHGKCEQGDLQIDWLLKTAAKQLESVRCPDGKSECPDGNTCCKLPSGDYGCCPLPNAVCCSDGEHCCPHGYTCDVSHGKCEQGDLQIDWLLKTAAKQLESVRCPDGKSECPDGNTCCKLPSGDYGCCPLPNAVCCSDGEHCCPHGYTCDVSHGKCEQGDLQIDWLLKTAAKQLESVRCPDGKSECPDGNTCCKLPSGDYGCCPLPNAVCCSDGEHCCPHGYTCDVSHGKCEQGDLQIDWLLKTAAKQLESVRCPDGKSECPDGNTCCKLPSGDYGCCPLPNAVCCSDGEHCCPHGYTCDVSHGKCEQGDLQIDWLLKTAAKQLESVRCPDGKSECPDGNTCCKLPSGDYGCCPLPNAVCCSDGEHCCPHGYTCDVSHGKCEQGDLQIDWLLKTAAKQLESVRCPDGKSECPDGSTCCKLPSGDYGCCPLPNAVCCSDHHHCCPSGTTCDVAQGKCNRGDTWLEWFEKTPTKQLENIVCPDGKSMCADGQTCCKLSTGSYGCCPIPHAVCCSDHRHCCPSGTTCDVSQGKCNRGDTWLEWFEKVPAEQLENVVCPDGKSMCADGQTCCKLSTGSYGCCPIPHAVCCSDHRHCCPSGTTCDVAQGKCNRGDTWLEWFEKVPAEQLENVVCPDGKSMCADGQTCCKLSTGSYGCCPIPHAVCCSDHRHCCPSGTTCDVAQGKCNRGDTWLEWFEKVPADQLENVVCPDGKSMCADGQTCCKLSTGSYGCCPIPHAVCCSDHRHCCPSGTTCDVAQGKCNRGDTWLEWFEKVPAEHLENVVCPDGKSMCADGQTCCKLSTGSYGCCPIPHAVCCNDHRHCCPSGTTCDVAQGKCNRGDTWLEWFEKVPADQLENVVCPDGKSMCADGQTCCKLSTGSYGCCPLPHAVCCSDHRHCCPSGTTCDVAQGKCNRGDTWLEWFEKVPAKQLENVVCPDGKSMCADGQTCCKLPTGSYGCCPIPHAVCCSDHLHCCPSGTTCDVAQGKCNRGDTWLEWFEKVPAKQLENVVCPDGKSMCADGQTCCKLSTGSYGCCPLPHAVCCSDHRHCCPSGTTCDVAQGKCNRGDIWLDWFEKVPAKQLENVVCPDGKSMCADGQTCCKLPTGSYGCCPLSHAVCCSDHVHCCPEGTTCDLAHGSCNKGDVHTDWFEKIPAIVPNPVQCDPSHECPTGNTCCRLPDGRWGCCPQPDAVCCSDHTHCCPHGTVCNVTVGKCIGDETDVDWFVKTPAKHLGRVVCPGGQFDCPDGTTCCQTPGEHWACCPMPNAVCCSDHKHCCPQGTKCLSSGQCVGNGLDTDWSSKILATPRSEPVSVGDVVCPDGSVCEDGCTCCKMSAEDTAVGEKDYGCCPLPNAVCCPDGKHCCPNGFKCNMVKSDCEKKGLLQLPWLSVSKKHKKEKKVVPMKESSGIVCPGGKPTCPDLNTCCDDGSGGYYCCPEDNAVCCKDHKYCCPKKYRCGDQPGICLSDFQSIFIQKISAKLDHP